MGQVVPVNRFTRAANIGRRGYPHTSLNGYIPRLSSSSIAVHRALSIMEVIPAGTFHHRIKTFAQRATGDAQAVDSARIRFDQVTPAQFNRVNTEVMRDFVQVRLDRVARLCGTMPAFGAAG